MPHHRYLISSDIAAWGLQNQHVILRADLNVPIEYDNILDTSRLSALLPTLELLCQKDAIIHIITHRGSPTLPTQDTSTTPLARWFADAGYTLPQVHVHENLRFTIAEKDQDHHFAQTLARGMQWYINDAFGALHRSDASLTILPRLFSRDHRSVGLLVERELAHIVPITISPQRPYGILLGGGKIATKLPYIAPLLSSVDYVFVCPNIASIFIPSQAHHFPEHLHALRSKILSHHHASKLLLPLDYLVRTSRQSYKCKPTVEITTDDIPLAIGPQTVNRWIPYLSSLATIVCNGPMGFASEPSTRHTLQQLLAHINGSTTHTIIGGGDMILAANMLVPQAQFSWYSTGGGSLLALLSDSPLPALDALNQPEFMSPQ